MNKSELKPCPFCGGADINSEGVTNKGQYFCHDCGCFGPNPVYDVGFGNDLPNWNTRPNPINAELVELANELSADLEKILSKASGTQVTLVRPRAALKKAEEQL